MKMKPYHSILSIAASSLLFSIASAHDEHDPGFKEEVIYEDGKKIVVKTIHMHIDFKEEYEALKAKWDKRQESWDAREKKHQEAMRKLREDLKVDNEEYEKIRKLLGARLWTQSSEENLQKSIVAKARGSYASDEMLMEYSFLFKNYPEDGAGLKGSRRSYALLLLSRSKVERGMTLEEIESVIGEPNDAIEVDDAEFIVYNMYPDKKHALLLEIEGKKVSEIYFGDRDGSNLKLWELHPQLRN